MINRYTQVYKTGEKKYGVVNKRGRKPLGFIRYVQFWKGSWVAWEYIRNKDRVYMLVKKGNK